MSPKRRSSFKLSARASRKKRDDKRNVAARTSDASQGAINLKGRKNVKTKLVGRQNAPIAVTHVSDEEIVTVVRPTAGPSTLVMARPDQRDRGSEWDGDPARKGDWDPITIVV